MPAEPTPRKNFVAQSGDWLPKGDRVPEFGSPEHLRVAGYHEEMAADEKALFFYRRYLQDSLHGYE